MSCTKNQIYFVVIALYDSGNFLKYLGGVYLYLEQDTWSADRTLQSEIFQLFKWASNAFSFEMRNKIAEQLIIDSNDVYEAILRTDPKLQLKAALLLTVAFRIETGLDEVSSNPNHTVTLWPSQDQISRAFFAARPINPSGKPDASSSREERIWATRFSTLAGDAFSEEGVCVDFSPLANAMRMIGEAPCSTFNLPVALAELIQKAQRIIGEGNYFGELECNWDKTWQTFRQLHHLMKPT